MATWSEDYKEKIVLIFLQRAKYKRVHGRCAHVVIWRHGSGLGTGSMLAALEFEVARVGKYKGVWLYSAIAKEPGSSKFRGYELKME